MDDTTWREVELSVFWSAIFVIVLRESRDLAVRWDEFRWRPVVPPTSDDRDSIIENGMIRFPLSFII